MSSPNPSLLNAQVNRVHRRLFVQLLVTRLMGCLIGSLAIALVWFLIQPFLLEGPQPWLRWAVAGGIVALGMGLAGILAWRNRPSKLASALSLDEQFDLKERVTTSLSLTPEQLASPVGQALLDDVHSRVEKLDVFPEASSVGVEIERHRPNLPGRNRS